VADPPANGAAGAPATVSLRLAAGPLTRPVLARVVSMVLARAGAPMDRLDDAMMICDAVAALAPAHTRDNRFAMTVLADSGGIELRVGELSADGARGLVADAEVPGVGNVLERMSDELRVVPSSETSGEQVVLVLRYS
jgi:hypothetical protein